MKTILCTAIISMLFASPALSQNEIGERLFDHLISKPMILTNGEIIDGQNETKAYVSNFRSENGENEVYEKKFDITVNSQLDYEIGTIRTDAKSFAVMFIKRKGEPSGPKIEFLVIYEENDPDDLSSVLDQQREQWMELCNAHKANDLVEQLYTSDAFYYNRGRLLRGTQEISSEYGYMNAASYSLKLIPKHVRFITSDIAYEIGRCSGSYPLPYMLLWEKQEDGNWQILMDSNY